MGEARVSLPLPTSSPSSGTSFLCFFLETVYVYSPEIGTSSERGTVTTAMGQVGSPQPECSPESL